MLHPSCAMSPRAEPETKPTPDPRTQLRSCPGQAGAPLRAPRGGTVPGGWHMSPSWRGASLHRDHVLRALAHRWASLLQGCGLPGSVPWMSRRGSCSACPTPSPAPSSPHSKGLFEPQCCSIPDTCPGSHGKGHPWLLTQPSPSPSPSQPHPPAAPRTKPVSCHSSWSPQPCLARAAARQTWSRTFPRCLWYQRASKVEASP